MVKYKHAKLGLFWFVGHSYEEFIEYSLPWKNISSVGGFRTVDTGHAEVWEGLRCKRADLRSFGYEYFPRGRVNYDEGNAIFLLLVDKKINNTSCISLIIDRWNLPLGSTMVMGDPHYRCNILTTIYMEGGDYED
jgi:hypothetical protein